MVSLRRRQVIIAGLGTAVAPAVISAAIPAGLEKQQRLVLSGRILGSDGKPLAGATVSVGRDRITTDADGRFVLFTDTSHPRYRVTFRGSTAGGFVSDARRDGEGAWRATFCLMMT